MNDKRKTNGSTKRNARNAGGNVCDSCGADLSVPGAVAHADHWCPRSRPDAFLFPDHYDYRDEWWNIVCSCGRCNLCKHTKLPPLEHPNTVRFILFSIAEDAYRQWAAGYSVPAAAEKRAYWDAHDGQLRRAAEDHLRGRKVNFVRARLQEQYQLANANHFIHHNLLYSVQVEEIILAHDCDLELLLKGFRVVFGMHQQPMLSLLPDKHLELCTAALEEWSEMCRRLKAGEPLPEPLRYADRYDDPRVY